MQLLQPASRAALIPSISSSPHSITFAPCLAGAEWVSRSSAAPAAAAAAAAGRVCGATHYAHCCAVAALLLKDKPLQRCLLAATTSAVSRSVVACQRLVRVFDCRCALCWNLLFASERWRYVRLSSPLAVSVFFSNTL